MDDQTQKDVSSLSDEELNSRVAQWLGWKDVRTHSLNSALWQAPDGIIKVKGLPDYCNDLNAMHEAEKILCHRKHNYFNQLVKSLRQGQMSITSQQWLPVITATARQRAEAFVKTLTP